MTSQALYLKWRPKDFGDVVGQEHITRTLQNALRSGRVAHAYLFTGPRGTGKTTMARLLAKAVNCLDEDVNNRPCNRCHICTDINQGRLLDLIEMDAASNTGVDNVREAIREKVGFRPNEARFKVYVIDEVHMLSTSAFNALLKTLEEPPEHVIFILATTEPHKILPTIISRCQRFDFRRIPLSALVGRLRYIADQESVQVEDAALRFMARMSTGCARDAIGLLDQLTAYGDETITAERVSQVLGLGDLETVHTLAVHLAQGAVGRGLDVIHQAVEQGVDCRQFTQQIVDYTRSLLLLCLGDQAGIEGSDAQTQVDMQALARQFSAHQLVRAIKLFNQAQLDLRGSDQNQIALELAFVEAALGEQHTLAEQRAPVEKHTIGELHTLAEQRAPVERYTPVKQPATAEQTPAAVQPAGQEPQQTPAPSSAVQTPADQDAASQAAETSRFPTPPAKQSQQPVVSSATSRPTAPPKSVARQPDRQPEAKAVEADETPSPSPAAFSPAGTLDAVTMEELAQNWDQIKHAVRTQSRQAEALLNSAEIEGIEDGNRVVLALPSQLLAEKLDKATTKQAIEQGMQSVLNKTCRIRTKVGSSPALATGFGASQPPFDPGPVAPVQAADSAQQTDMPAGIHQEALDDPVVRELERLGGKVVDIEELEYPIDE
ncbi:MAG: DNA polymerase III subunit gamma/tau [Anaerolineae bacterium]|nr:DNA polymerase III subunit gamma/tau [Anaerolineae bacterium]